MKAALLSTELNLCAHVSNKTLRLTSVVVPGKRRAAFILTLTSAIALVLGAYFRVVGQNPSAASEPSTPNSQALPLFSDTERDLKGGESHSYRITLKPGQFLFALIEQKGIDVTVGLFNPEGKQVSLADSPNDQWGTEPVLVVAETAGEYRVQVTSPNSKAPAGSYAIKIVALRTASDLDRGHAKAEALFEEGRKLRSQQTAESRRAALLKYEASLPLFEAAGDSYRQALTLISIGLTHAQLNEFREAQPYFNRALSLSRNFPDRRLEAATETFLGGMDDVLGNSRNALDHYNQALTLSRASGNRSAEATSLNNIGKVYNDLADWQKALDYYRQSLPLQHALGNQRSEARALQNIGVAYQLLGEPNEALTYFQEALLLNRSIGEKNTEAEMLTLVGSAYYDLGDTKNAFEFYNQALKLDRELGNRGLEAGTLDRIGKAYASQRQPEQAISYLQKALDLRHAIGDRRREAISLSNAGYVYNLLGQPEKAEAHFAQALDIFRSIGDLNSAAIALEGSAQTQQSRGNLDEARKRIEESLSLIDLVRARSQSQQLRASYLASMEKAYEIYIALLMQLHEKDPRAGHDAEALQASERARARSLTELLNEARVNVRQGVDAKLIEQERYLGEVINAKAQRQIQLKAQKGNEREIATLDKEISALEDDYRQTQTAIRKQSPQYAALTQPQPLALKTIQQQLDQDTVLLEYSLGEERSYLWIVGLNSLKTFVLPKREEIEKSARHVYELITSRSDFRALESAAQRQQRVADADTQLLKASGDLSAMIIAPFAAEFAGKRLVVVADGALQYVPFGALPLSEKPTATAAFTSGQTLTRPLIVTHEIASLPSASALAVQRLSLAGRKLAPNVLAVLADPVFSTTDERLKPASRATGERRSAASVDASSRSIEHTAGSPGKLSIQRLKFTRLEADQILAVAPSAGNLKAIDFNANRATATSADLSRYRYVHFATHGYLDTERPDLSAIVLSLVDEKGNPLDGFLRAREIYNLHLPAELVVLSACQTGLGKEIKGEGLVGLTRGFMYAGARRVLVSLWDVNDKATAELMQRFYRHMLKDNRSPAASLRAAQVEMWNQKQWQSPYYWAAFTMQGEWR